MDKSYIPAEIEIVIFDSEDVITTSIPSLDDSNTPTKYGWG